MTPRSRRTLVVLTSGALLVSAGTAYAYVRTTGSGSGTASTANGLTAFHTTAAVALGAKLFPGASAPLTVNIDNTGGNYQLTVTSLVLDASRSITGCTTPAITVSAPGGWTGIVVAAHSSSGPTTIAGAVTMGAAASNDCQGATLTIPVTLTGHS
jgi:hypothetical protein